jgi:hypothetical protein
MLDALIITEAEAAGLSRLAALDLAMAEDFAARAQAAEDPDTACDLARSYQRMARSYRQSLALKVRLAREIRLAERDAPPPPPVPLDEAGKRERVETLRSAVRGVIWAEYEPAEDDGDEELCVELFERLDTRLAQLRSQPGFGQAPLDDEVRAVCRTLRLDAALAICWKSFPEPPEDAALPEHEPEQDPSWRGSG